MSNQTTALAPAQRLNNVRSLLMNNKEQLAMALPKHLTAEKMIRIALTALSKTPLLLECDQKSLFGSIMTLSQLGLAPDGVLGEAYLLPFKNTRNNTYECQMIIGYRGLVSLAHRSGIVARFQARSVYEGDEFEYEFGLDEKLVHKPCGIKSDDKLTHVYAVLQYKDGSRVFDVMTKAEVEFARIKSKGANNPVWKTHYEEMAKKTIIRRLSKIAPLSPEFQTAVGLDEQHEVLGKSQKNEMTLLNYDLPAELKQEVEDTIDADVEIMEQEAVEQKIEQSAAKGNAATAAAEAALNAKGGK